MSEMDTPFFSEYSYDRRAEGSRLILRTAAIISYLLFVGAYFGVAYFTRLIPLFALCPVALWIMIYFTWPILSYDYYFEFRTGTLTLGVEKRKRKRTLRSPKLVVQVKNAEKIYPLPAGRVKLSGVSKCYDFSGTVKSEKRIAIVFDKDGKKCACIVECTAALAKMLRSYSQNCENLADLIKS